MQADQITEWPDSCDRLVHVIYTMFRALPRSPVAGFRCTAYRFATRSAQRVSLQRMLSTLAILEQRGGELQISSLSAVTAGQKLGGSVHALLAGSDVDAAAEMASKAEGVEKVLKIQNEHYERGMAENYAPMVVENIKKGGYTHVVASHSAFGKSILPRVAALLDSQPLSDVMEIQNEDSEHYANIGISRYADYL